LVQEYFLTGHRSR